MSIKPVEKSPELTNMARLSAVAGLTATAIKGLTLPAEAKAAIKNTRFGQDAFVKKSQKAAIKTMKNLGKEFDLGLVAENAKNMYPEMKTTATKTFKSLGATFVGVSVAVMAGKLIANKLINNKVEKQ